MTESEKVAYKEDRFFKLSMEPLAVASKRGGLWKRANPAFCRTFGWSEDELRKTSYFKLTHPDDLEKSKRAFAELKADEHSVLLDNRMRCKDGGYLWISWKLAQFPSERRVYCAGRDVTDSKQEKEALRAAEERERRLFEFASELNETLKRQVDERTSSAEARTKQLQTLAVELIEAEERERRRFAKLLHDDLQQILAAARLQLSAAREDMPELNVLANVEHLIRESIRKARALSHDLSPAVLHHSGLMAALKWLSRHMLDHFGLQVEIDERAASDFENSSYKVFIFRAVRELLFNVVKHADVKKAQIGLSSSGDNLVLTVSDQGKGFDPVVSISCEVKAGLGLISLRERALAIGGELAVESAPGQGSRFTLAMPLTRVKTGEAEDFVLPAESIIPTPAGFAVSPGEGDIRVLFADDHQVMRQGLIELLTGQPNIEVIGEAASGREALELTRQLKPDVVLMDVSMPEMDGIEATRRIKEELPEVRVIGLTMFDGEQMARRMLNAGVEAFVSKTASSSELLRAIYGVGRQEDESG